MIDDLYHKYSIPVAPEGHKHSRPGWVNIECPHCVKEGGYHLGFNQENAYFYCWRCGSHSIHTTLMKLLRVSYNEADSIAKTYKLFRKKVFQKSTAPVVKINKQTFRFPSEIVDLQKPHKQYLVKRNFDPDYLAEVWGLKGTSPTSSLSITRNDVTVKIDYKYRILIPIEWEGRAVTFQARDYTGKQEIKYKACPEERESIHHKHILYGHKSLWEKRRAILVEGAADVWRIGVNACCTFGTGYTPEQTRLIVEKFDELFIMFDPEPIAQKRAKELQQELAFWGVKAVLYDPGLTTDPGDMTEEQARYVLKDLKMI